MKRVIKFATAMLAGMVLSVNAFCQQPFALVCVTGQAGEITTDSAVIKGLVAHNAGEPLNIAYGVRISTDIESIDKGEAQWFSRMVSEGDFFSGRVDFLKPGTTYYYKAIARTYGAGSIEKEVTSTGRILSFTTDGMQLSYNFDVCRTAQTMALFQGSITINNLKSREAPDFQTWLVVAPGILDSAEDIVSKGEANELTLTDVEGVRNQKAYTYTLKKLTKNTTYTCVIHIKANGVDYYSQPYRFKTAGTLRGGSYNRNRHGR